MDSDQTLHGSSRLPSVMDLGGGPVQLGTIVSAAHAASGLSVDEWNALPDDDRESRLANEIRALTARPTPPPPVPSATNVEAAFYALALARALTLPPHGMPVDKPAFARGSIERFAEEDGSQFNVVHIGGAFYKDAVVVLPEQPQQE